MKPCWRDWGLTDDGARQAEVIIRQMVTLVELTGGEIARVVLEEARFRVERLPKRAADYQDRYRRENGA